MRSFLFIVPFSCDPDVTLNSAPYQDHYNKSSREQFVSSRQLCHDVLLIAARKHASRSRGWSNSAWRCGVVEGEEMVTTIRLLLLRRWSGGARTCYASLITRNYLDASPRKLETFIDVYEYSNKTQIRVKHRPRLTA
ncbi:hypothetical protein E2C01_077667 [Portunus trituberculatus]|uniref:Uncharacterized protein n=1 Tax=Portunus trituberculatus TaxID=210409 RepID=A0A5B7IQB2_PORTR|nr:hypothetical protein [Portunus trituberculatus]